MTVLSKFVEAVQTGEPQTNYYFYAECWKNALYNLMTAPQHAPVEGKMPSRLVAGSLQTADGHGIWGTDGLKNPQAFLDDFSACHVWVEDGDGRIWDLLTEDYNGTVAKRLKHVGKASSVATHIPVGGIEIEGMTALEIEKTYGYRFIPAPAHCQAHIFSECFSRWLPYRPYAFHTGKNFVEGWIGIGYKAPTIQKQIQKNAIFQRINKFGEAISGTSHEAQRWWRTEVWGKPADTKHFNFYIAQMGDDMMPTDEAMMPQIEVFANTGVCPDALAKIITPAIDSFNDEPNEEDLLWSLYEAFGAGRVQDMD